MAICIHIHKTKDAGEDQLNQCRGDLTSISSKLSRIGSTKGYDDSVRKAAKEAERLIDQARDILFKAA